MKYDNNQPGVFNFSNLKLNQEGQVGTVSSQPAGYSGTVITNLVPDVSLDDATPEEAPVESVQGATKVTPKATTTAKAKTAAATTAASGS